MTILGPPHNKKVGVDSTNLRDLPFRRWHNLDQLAPLVTPDPTVKTMVISPGNEVNNLLMDTNGIKSSDFSMWLCLKIK